MAMKKTAAGIGFAIALIALSGCAPPPAPMVAEAPPPPLIATVPVALVPELPPPRPVHRVAVAHPTVRTHVVHHHPARRYASRTRASLSGLPYCGSTQRPCNVEHVTVPIQ
jgi:hypothetical protein